MSKKKGGSSEPKKQYRSGDPEKHAETDRWLESVLGKKKDNGDGGSDPTARKAGNLQEQTRLIDREDPPEEEPEMSCKSLTARFYLLMYALVMIVGGGGSIVYLSVEFSYFATLWPVVFYLAVAASVCAIANGAAAGLIAFWGRGRCASVLAAIFAVVVIVCALGGCAVIATIDTGHLYQMIGTKWNHWVVSKPKIVCKFQEHFECEGWATNCSANGTNPDHHDSPHHEPTDAPSPHPSQHTTAAPSGGHHHSTTAAPPHHHHTTASPWEAASLTGHKDGFVAAASSSDSSSSSVALGAAASSGGDGNGGVIPVIGPIEFVAGGAALARTKGGSRHDESTSAPGTTGAPSSHHHGGHNTTAAPHPSHNTTEAPSTAAPTHVPPGPPPKPKVYYCLFCAKQHPGPAPPAPPVTEAPHDHHQTTASPHDSHHSKPPQTTGAPWAAWEEEEQQRRGEPRDGHDDKKTTKAPKTEAPETRHPASPPPHHTPAGPPKPLPLCQDALKKKIKSDVTGPAIGGFLGIVLLGVLSLVSLKFATRKVYTFGTNEW